TASDRSNTSITAGVPTEATTGPIVETVASQASGATFTVTPARNIGNLSPISGTAGAPVNIAGSNFGSSQRKGSVTFNRAPAIISSWSSGLIATTVPAGATSGNVVGSAAGGVANNGVPFAVPPQPGIIALQPNSGSPGAIITISGQNFGSS